MTPISKLESRYHTVVLSEHMPVYIPDKKETQRVEIAYCQKDHERRISFVYFVSKVCQLLLLYTSYAIMGQNALETIGHKPSLSQIIKSHKISVFIMLSFWLRAM